MILISFKISVSTVWCGNTAQTFLHRCITTHVQQLRRRTSPNPLVLVAKNKLEFHCYVSYADLHSLYDSLASCPKEIIWKKWQYWFDFVSGYKLKWEKVWVIIKILTYLRQQYERYSQCRIKNQNVYNQLIFMLSGSI